MHIPEYLMKDQLLAMLIFYNNVLDVKFYIVYSTVHSVYNTGIIFTLIFYSPYFILYYSCSQLCTYIRQWRRIKNLPKKQGPIIHTNSANDLAIGALSSAILYDAHHFSWSWTIQYMCTVQYNVHLLNCKNSHLNCWISFKNE